MNEDSVPNPTDRDTTGSGDETDLTSAFPSNEQGHVYEPTVTHSFDDSKLNKTLTLVSEDPEIQAYLEAQNVNPVERLGYNDHGETHIQIVRSRALSLYELLKDGGVECNGAQDHQLEQADEPVIIALAATLHDIGHVVHRDNHPYYSIPLAADILDRILPELGYDIEATVKLKSEILHAIVVHHTEEQPLTTEAGIVRVADALDMEHGRSRVPYEQGGRGINTVSSRAIRNVSLHPGNDVPVIVEIEMIDAAGVYQVDELLKSKLSGSTIEDHVRIVAVNTRSDDSDLVERIEL